MKRKKNLTIDEYIKISKTDIVIYSIIFSILFLVLLYICYIINFYEYLLLSIFGLIIIIGRILNYLNIKKIKVYLLENNLINDIGKIYFWNEEKYLLTDKYLFIIEKGIINYFKYEEIKEIFKEYKIDGTKNMNIEEYLNIKLINEKTYKILINSTLLSNQINKDITELLLEKNKNIMVVE